jgi:histidinol-phosphate aminotransferase
MIRPSRRGVLGVSGVLAAANSLVHAAAAETSPRIIARLNHNENPFGPSPRAREALQSLGANAWRYPYEEVAELRRQIAAYERVQPENVFVGEGSGEILKVVAIVHGRPGREIVAARPTYATLPRYAAQQGAAVTWVDVDNSFTHDLAAMKAAITDATSVVYVCNPNNPTGTVLDPTNLRAFVTDVSKRALVVVDEAYLDFVAAPDKATMVDRVKAGDNVLVTRSFSKIHGLAGLRIGYGLARSDIIQRLESVRISIPNQAGVVAASASLRDENYRAEMRNKIGESSAFCTRLFQELGLAFIPTQANFMMFDTRKEATVFMEFARSRDVMLAPVGGRFANWVRVSMGRPEHMDLFAQTLRAFVRT